MADISPDAASSKVISQTCKRYILSSLYNWTNPFTYNKRNSHTTVYTFLPLYMPFSFYFFPFTSNCKIALSSPPTENNVLPSGENLIRLMLSTCPL